jgi:hypothetical protein
MEMEYPQTYSHHYKEVAEPELSQMIPQIETEETALVLALQHHLVAA